jgi:hypothetical protein
VLQLSLISLLGHQLLGLHWNQNSMWYPNYLCRSIQMKRPILGVTIIHGVLEDSYKIRSLQVEIRIIGDYIIDSQHSTRQCVDKGFHIQVCLLVCHGLVIVLGRTMMSLYILVGLFWSHIYVIGLHDCIKIDYCIEAKN